MISIELLSNVIGLDILEIKIYNSGSIVNNYNEILYNTRNGAVVVNIYELSYKCKQWARKKGFQVYSVALNSGGEVNLYGVSKKDMDDISFAPFKTFHSKTELEAIFNACQWILVTDKDTL